MLYEVITAEVGRRPLQEIMEGVERELLDQALQQAQGNKLQAAGLLGISRPGLITPFQ